jgi:hypothetical protein
VFFKLDAVELIKLCSAVQTQTDYQTGLISRRVHQNLPTVPSPDRRQPHTDAPRSPHQWHHTKFSTPTAPNLSELAASHSKTALARDSCNRNRRQPQSLHADSPRRNSGKSNPSTLNRTPAILLSTETTE